METSCALISNMIGGNECNMVIIAQTNEVGFNHLLETANKEKV